MKNMHKNKKSFLLQVKREYMCVSTVFAYANRPTTGSYFTAYVESRQVLLPTPNRYVKKKIPPCYKFNKYLVYNKCVFEKGPLKKKWMKNECLLELGTQEKVMGR